jgi:hypothetical protein
MDVLAVINDAVLHLRARRAPPHYARDLNETRLAVAELIEAAKFARYTAAGQTGYTDGADRRLAAAIAAVGGAS